MDTSRRHRSRSIHRSPSPPSYYRQSGKAAARLSTQQQRDAWPADSPAGYCAARSLPATRYQRPSECPVCEQRWTAQFLTPLRLQELRIVQQPVAKAVGQNRRARKNPDRPSNRAPPHQRPPRSGHGWGRILRSKRQLRERRRSGTLDFKIERMKFKQERLSTYRSKPSQAEDYIPH